MIDKTLPCPFCGSADLVIELGPFVICQHCGAEGPIGDDDDHAQELWNQRVFTAREPGASYSPKRDT